MKSLKDNKSKELFNKILGVIILLLFVSNLYFYREFKRCKNNANYMSGFSSSIAIAANSNDLGFLLSKLVPEDSDDLISKFEKIKPMIGNQYSIINYIAIEYKNGNTLMVKAIEYKDGKYLIGDMFVLDELTYKKIKHDTMYGK